MNSADIIVLGMGGLGSVVAHDLACSGARVLGLDRHPPGHGFGSSHGQTRVIRQAYFEDPAYVPLLQHSYTRWRDLEAWSGHELMDLCGVLEVGPSDGVVVPGVLRAAQRHDLNVRVMTMRELTECFPQIRAPEGDHSAVLETDGGLLQVEACVRAWAHRAEAVGAVLQTGATVLGYSHEGTHWRVVTDQGDCCAQRLVLCPGAWAPRLAPSVLGRHLTVLRKPLLWFDAPPAFNRSNGFPCWLFEEKEAVFYGFPALANQGFKVAQHSGGESITNPTALDRSLRRDDHAPIEDFLAQRMPSVRGASCRDHAVCMYTMTPDEHPMVGPVDGYEHLYVGLGLSGHGFKMVPGLGALLASQVLEQSGAPTLERFNPMRFA